jgi:hypothetical protein
LFVSSSDSALLAHSKERDELVRRFLAARDDPRSVIADPHARYYGARLGERMLVPDNATIGETGFEDWLSCQFVSATA